MMYSVVAFMNLGCKLAVQIVYFRPMMKFD